MSNFLGDLRRPFVAIAGGLCCIARFGGERLYRPIEAQVDSMLDPGRTLSALPGLVDGQDRCPVANNLC
jgi:hypothetical protein